MTKTGHNYWDESYGPAFLEGPGPEVEGYEKFTIVLTDEEYDKVVRLRSLKAEVEEFLREKEKVASFRGL